MLALFYVNPVAIETKNMLDVLSKALSSGQIPADDKRLVAYGLIEPLQAFFLGDYFRALTCLSGYGDAHLANHQPECRAYLKIRCLLATGQFDAASKVLNATLTHAPNFASHKNKLEARLLLSNGQTALAVRLLTHCLELDKNDWEALSLLAAMGGEGSEQLFLRSLCIFPDQADALRNRAALKIKRGIVSEAVDHLEHALEIRPCYAPALELLHPLLMQLGKTETLDHFYIQLPRKSWTAKLSGLYLDLLFIRGRSEEAWARAKVAAECWPNDADLLLCVASAAQRAGHHSAARQLYKNIRGGPSAELAARALNNLALLAIDDGDLPHALDCVQEALRYDPSNVDLKLHFSELLLRSGDQIRASEILEQMHNNATNFNTEQKRRWLQAQSRLEQLQGNLQLALELADQACQHSPGHADVWLQKSSVLVELQRTEDAIALIQLAATQVQNPRSLRATWLAYVLKQGQLDRANKLLEKWLENDPKDFELLSQRAALQMDFGNFEQAERELVFLADKYPDRGKIPLVKFFLKRNRPKEALEICREAIDIDPKRLLPYQLAAKALQLMDRWEEATVMLKAAFSQDPDRLDVLSDLVRNLQYQGRNSEAIELIESRVASQPRLPIVRLGLQILQRTHDWERGLLLIGSLEKVDPENSELPLLKSRVLRRIGRSAEALGITANLVASNPQNLKLREAHIRELLIQERFAEAKAEAYALAECLPDTPQRLLQLTSLLALSDAPEEALEQIQQHMMRWPEHPELPWREVDLLDQLSRTQEAQVRLDRLVSSVGKPSVRMLERATGASLRHHAYESALLYAQLWYQLQPENTLALWQQFSIFEKQNRLHEALAVLAIIRGRNPNDRQLNSSESIIYTKMARYQTATELLDQAIAFDPTNLDLRDQRLMVRASAGDFNGFDKELAELDKLRAESRYQAHKKYFFNINCHPGWTADRIYSFHRGWFENAILPDLPPIPVYPDEQLNPKKRLKVGYVSGDFRVHAVAYFSEPLLLGHDREQFELYAFATNNPMEGDCVTERFRSYVHHWIDAYGMNDGELYRKIRSLGIDILVDLSGHTNGSRLSVFARKPSPLQFSAAFGAGQTTGISRIDYLLCDQVTVPKEHAPYLSERRAVLPFVGCPYKPRDDFLSPVALPSMAGAFTFACIARPVRVNAQVCSVWGSILAACPDAQLVFEHGNYEEPEVQDRYRSLLTDAGASAGQIIFRNTRPYWKVFHHVDLLLDPWPAGSGTVGTDALWMERLTITLVSRPIMGRAMMAQLTALGLADRFVCADVESYRNRAIYFASTEEGRRELHQSSSGLRQRFKDSLLMDYESYGRALAQLYRKLWTARCAHQ